MNALQLEILDIYKVVKKICDDNNLRYFALGGTCIGAIRHRGFIPWDDDMDLIMPRKDYDLFIKIANRELPDHIELFDGSRSLHCDFPFLKVHNSKTTFVSSLVKEFPDSYTGVHVDIMPFDGVPPSGIARKYYTRSIELLNHFSNRRKFGYYAVPEDVRHKLLYRLSLQYFKINHPNHAMNLLKLLVRTCRYDNSRSLIFSWFHHINGMIFNKTDFEDCVEVPFEDTVVRVPKGYDNYMRTQFGDYMSLPPEHEQVGSHQQGSIVDLHRSYKLYAKDLDESANRK